MNRLTTLTAVGALASAATLAPPAAATHGDWGYTCGLEAVASDAAGIAAFGIVHGGPFYAGNPSPDTQITVRCTVLRSTAEGEPGEVVADAELTTPGGVGVLPPQPFALPTDDLITELQQRDGGDLDDPLYLCTEITVYQPGASPPVRTYSGPDADPSQPGSQCSKTEPEDGDLVYVYREPPTETGGDWCVYWSDDPDVWPAGVCPPIGA